MLLSLKWLREFTPYQGSAEELGDRLTMLGLELEEIIHPFAGLEQVVVGKVLETAPHPQADKLTVCTVDVGQGENLSIVCGAPNVAAGQTVPVALVGAALPGGLTIKKAKLRGVESRGMICAEDEIGLGEDHAGIMVLSDDLPLGQPIIEALNLDDVVIDVAITPNRADCLSVLGLAREVAMAFDLPLTLPSFELREEGPEASSQVTIEIPEGEYCPVYRARVLHGVTVGKSPAWMRYRLIAVGQRPINNIVDVTNYVMLELGQPLHSFDQDLLEGGTIRVARADEGMRFTTLDDQERRLTDQDLLIWDGVKPVALAGVMGGANSEMHAGSVNVLLEAAVFRPASVRKTARRLALPSESSYRFERGVDQPGSLFAMNRAAELMVRHAGGRVLPGWAEAEPRPFVRKTIAFRPERARDLLGLPVDDAFCRKTLTALGCELQGEGENWTATAPGHRLDLEREADLIEEIGRVWGLDRIEARLPQVRHDLSAAKSKVSAYDFWTDIRAWAKGLGLREAVNYSFVGQKDLDVVGLPQEGRIPVMNPLSEDQNVLRPALIPGLLHTLRHNMSQGASRLRIFELARVFEADAESETTARENGRLGILLHGPRNEEAWPQAPMSEDNPDADYLDVKGLVEHLLSRLQLPAATFTMIKDHAWLSPAVEAKLGEESLGLLGRVRPEIADAYNGRRPVWVADVDLDLLMARAAGFIPSFQALPTFPPIRRDITVNAPVNLPVAAILEHIQSLRLPLLERVALTDLFIPEQEEKRRNLTFRLTFRHAQRTLKDKEVDKEREKVAESLRKTLSVSI